MEPKDASLLSVTGIGSPAAFSTAIKPPGNMLHQPSPDSSLMSQELPRTQTRISDVTGRLSLDSVTSGSGPSNKDGNLSLNDTSVGILDLDAMQDNSMDLFLTSPFGSKDLNLHLSTTMSVPSIQPSIKMHPTMDGTNNTNPPRFEQKIDMSSAIGYVPTSQMEDENVAIEKSAHIPQELLERISLSSGSELNSTQSSFDGGEENNPLEPNQHLTGEDGGQLAPTASPLFVNGSATGEESKSLTVEHLLTMEDTSPLKVGSQTHSLELQQSLVSGEVEGHKFDDDNGDDLPLSSQHFYSNGVNMVDETLIGDQVEPSVMQEADEFSQFDPTHLMSILNQDSLLTNSTRPSAANKSSSQQSPLHDAPHQLADSASRDEDTSVLQLTNEELNHSHANGSEAGEVSLMSSSTSSDEYASAVSDTPKLQFTSPPALEGLPEVYLASTSFPTDTSASITQYETSGLASFAAVSSPAPQTTDEVVTAVNSHSTLQSSSLGSSLSELAGTLGKRKDSQPGALPDNDNSGMKVLEQTKLDISHKNSSGVYNPFDSDDNASVDSFGQMEFGEPSSDDFLAQLNKDEESIKKMNLTNEQQFSFNVTTGSPFTDTSAVARASGGGDMSITSYFQQRSHKMGELSHAKPPPSERPRFSDTSSRVIQSPPDININTPHQASSATPTSMLDTPTSTASNNRDKTLLPSSEIHVPTQEDGSLDKTLVSGNGSVNTSYVAYSPGASVGLTPRVTVHSPFPVQFQIPKLNFTDTSTHSTSLSAEKRLSPVTFPSNLAGSPPVQSDTQPVPSVAALTNVLTENSTELKTSPSNKSYSRLSSNLDSRLSSGSDYGLPSRYLKSSTDSTLVFPEMSAMSSFSHNLDVDSFGSVPTPSIARLPTGFDITDDTHQDSLLSFSPGVDGSNAGSKLNKSNETPQTFIEQSRESPKQSPIAETSPSTLLPSPALQNSGTKSATPVVESSHVQTTPVKTAEIESPKSSPFSPNTQAARQKLANLQTTLDAARFDAETFLAGLKSSSSPLHGNDSGITVTPAAESHGSPKIKSPENICAPSTTTSPLVLNSSAPLRVEDLLMKSSPLTSTQESVTAMLRITTTSNLAQSLPVTLTSPGNSSSSIRSSGLMKMNRNSSEATSTLSSSPQLVSPGLVQTKERCVTVKSTDKRLHKQSPRTPVVEPVTLSARVTLETPAPTLKSSQLQQSPTLAAAVDTSKGSLSRPRKPHTMTPFSSSTKKGSSKRKSKSDSFTSPKSPSKISPKSNATSPKKESSKKTAKSQPSPPRIQVSPRSEQTATEVESSPLRLSTLSQPNLMDNRSSRPIYTSPLSHPHTITSPTKKLHFNQEGMGGGASPGRPQSTTMDSIKSLRVPDSLCFDEVCCVGTSLCDQLVMTNHGERWLQLSFKLTQLYVDGTECSSDEKKAFILPQKCFVSPEKTEAVKVIFVPKVAGNYEAVLSIFARLVVSEKDPDHPVATVVLKALAEDPNLEVQTAPPGSVPSTPSPVLDYGVLVGGTSVSLPLRLTNRGAAAIPLCLSITSQVALSQLYFNFGNLPESLVPTSPPSSHLHSSQLHSATILLPPRPTGQAKLEYHSIDVRFTAPKKYFDSSTGDAGPPEEISAMLDVVLDSPYASDSRSKLMSVPLRAIVGVAQLHVPRSLQALSLSCTAGQAVTRDVPFKNAGNIPLKVRLNVATDVQNTLSVNPEFLLMELTEECQVQITFSPPTAPLTVEGCLSIHVEPSGPDYELKLRGTAIEQETQKEGLLSCNKRMLYWSGAYLNNSVQQKVILHNGYSTKIPLRLSIRHPDSNFQLQPLGQESASQNCRNGYDVEILPQEQLPVHVLFTPMSMAVCLSALDITDLLHSKKYRIRLCGYGGSSAVEVMNARRSPNGYSIDLGEVFVSQQTITKVSLYNSGQRAAFVTAACYPDRDSISPLPLDQASVAPSHFVIPPQKMGELLLVYSTSGSGSVPPTCLSSLACLKLVTGDELVRQRLCRVCARCKDSSPNWSLRNPDNNVYLRPFKHQETVPTELDFHSFEVEDEEYFFEQHLSTISISLSGSLPTENPLNLKSARTSGVTFDLSPPPRQNAISPSHTPLVFVGGNDLSNKQSPSLRILNSHTLTLPDTAVGHCSEKAMEICNPYSSPLHWHLNSVASPFLRNIGGAGRGSGEIFKANYSVFWVHEKRGIILPHQTSKVVVIFQPHDPGSFSQIWDLQISIDDIDDKRLRLSFGGKAVETQTRERPVSVLPHHGPSADAGHHSRAQQVTTWLSQTEPHMPFTSVPPAQSATGVVYVHAPGTTKKTTPPKRSIYLRNEEVNFPNTKPGSKSTMKVSVCNRDHARYKFNVFKPVSPFNVDHHSFELGSRQCARLPVHFAPSKPGEYEAVLALRTTVGHQAFAILKGKSST